MPDLDRNANHPRDVREEFWRHWLDWKHQGAWLAADCPWPVEARFLLECCRDRGALNAPYPLIDIASVLLAVGLDPLAARPRRAFEIPPHNPLADARQSARLLAEALRLAPDSTPNRPRFFTPEQVELAIDTSRPSD